MITNPSGISPVRGAFLINTPAFSKSGVVQNDVCTMNDFLIIVIAGFYSCFTLDLFGRFLLLVLKTPEPSWDVVGRWAY